MHSSKFGTHLLATILLVSTLAGCSKKSDRTENYLSTSELKKNSIEMQALNTNAAVFHVENGLTPEERQLWYRTAEGSDVVPVAFIQALKNKKNGKPFIETLDLYGFLNNPDDPFGLPVGMSANDPDFDDKTVPFVGINCAACHTGQLEYNGTYVRIDGAPNLSNFEAYVVDLADSVAYTLTNPFRAFSFVRDLIKLGKASKQTQQLYGLPAPTIDFVDSLRAGESETNLEHDVEQEIGLAFIDTSGEGDADIKPHIDKITSIIQASNRPDKDTFLDHAKRILQKLDSDEQFMDRRLTLVRRLKWAFYNQTFAGPGRGDSFDAIRDVVFGEKNHISLTAPTSFTDIFNLSDREWVHWDGNTTSPMQRNIAQAIAFGADVNFTTFECSALPMSLYQLETLARKIKTPKWPESVLGKIDPAKAERGKAVFDRVCLECHDSQKYYDLDVIGTDSNRALNVAQNVGDKPFYDAVWEMSNKLEAKLFETHKIGTNEAAKITYQPDPKWRTTRQYVARDIRGAWATGPYLHNGSVPTLYDLLQSATNRPATFKSGTRKFDPVKVGYRTDVGETSWIFDTKLAGNSNAGHEGERFGTTLSEDEKWDLIEYLKTR